MDLSGKSILVTGANGFIGSHLVRRLAQSGANVRGLVRTPRAAEPGIEYFTGDVTDAPAMSRAVESCDVVIHTAALQPFRPLPSRARFDAVNKGGTLNLLRAFRAAGQGRFLLLSTINVHGQPPPAGAGAESPLVYSGDRYADSKIDGERAAWAFAREHDIPLTVIRPGCTFGPGATAWTIQPIERIRTGRPVLIGHGRGLCNAIYVENLVDLIVAALQNEAAIGQPFIGSDGIGIEWREFFAYYARLLDKPLRAIPYPLARMASLASGFVERVTGQPGPLPRASVAFYSHRVIFNTDKNRRLLGVAPRVSFDVGMARTETWLRKVGIV